MLIYKMNNGEKITKDIQSHNFYYFKKFGWKVDNSPKVPVKKRGAKKSEEEKD